MGLEPTNSLKGYCSTTELLTRKRIKIEKSKKILLLQNKIVKSFFDKSEDNVSKNIFTQIFFHSFLFSSAEIICSTRMLYDDFASSYGTSWHHLVSLSCFGELEKCMFAD